MSRPSAAPSTTTPQRPDGDADRRPRSPWLGVAVLLIGSYGAVLNITVIGVAVPTIVDDLRVPGAPGGDWVVTAFLIGVVLALPLAGWAGERFGRVRSYTTAMAVFAVGGLLCAVAPNMWLLVAARLFQGVGSGALTPLAMATVYDLFAPSRRGMALGVWGVSIMAAPAVGPPLGGWLIDVSNWRVLFVIFAVLAALGVVLSARYLPETGVRHRRPVDTVGWGMLAVGIVALVVGSRQAAEWGVTDARSAGMVAVGVAAIAIVAVRSWHRPDPIIEFRMFAVPTFALAAIVVWLTSANQYGQLTLIPVELQVIRDLEAARVGALLAPAAFGIMATMPLGGWLADRVGARGPVVVGSVLMGAGSFQLAQLTPETPVRTVILSLAVAGLGQGLIFVPTSVVAINSLPGRFVSQASVATTLNRHLSSALGVALLSAVVVAQLGSIAPDVAASGLHDAQHAYNRVFLVSGGLAVVCGIVGLCLPGRRRALDQQRERLAEVESGTEPGAAEATGAAGATGTIGAAEATGAGT